MYAIGLKAFCGWPVGRLEGDGWSLVARHWPGAGRFPAANGATWSGSDQPGCQHLGNRHLPADPPGLDPADEFFDDGLDHPGS